MATLVDDAQHKIKGCTHAHKTRLAASRLVRRQMDDPISRDGRVHYTSFAWLDGLAECRSQGDGD
jgi:hypothetical protein